VVSTERVQALVFVYRLKTGGPKSLCVLVHCLGAKSNRDYTTVVSFCESFVATLLKPECKIVSSLSDLVVHI